MPDSDQPAVSLLVKQNRTSDHLANERTYLAWVRTAVALMGFGVVIMRLRYLLPAGVQGHTHGWELGLLFDLTGLLMVALAARHYFRVRHAIDTDTFQPSGAAIVGCTLAILLIGVGVLFYLLFSPISPPPASVGAV